MIHSNDQKIQARVNEFVQELTILIRQNVLETLKSAMGEAGALAVRRRGPGRPRSSAGSARGARRGRRPSAAVEQAGPTIVSYVRSNDGQGVIEIAKGTGVSLKDTKKAVLRLLATGELKKSGVRRGTKYHIGSGRAPAASKVRRGKRKARKARKAKARRPAASAESNASAA